MTRFGSSHAPTFSGSNSFDKQTPQREISHPIFPYEAFTRSVENRTKCRPPGVRALLTPLISSASMGTRTQVEHERNLLIGEHVPPQPVKLISLDTV